MTNCRKLSGEGEFMLFNPLIAAERRGLAPSLAVLKDGINISRFFWGLQNGAI